MTARAFYGAKTSFVPEDPSQTLADLAGLGSRLSLPKGWTFSTRTLDADYLLEANGVAVVVRDELQNTYQRR